MFKVLSKNTFCDSAFNLIARKVRAENVDHQFSGFGSNELVYIFIAHLDRTGSIRFDVLEDEEGTFKYLSANGAA